VLHCSFLRDPLQSFVNLGVFVCAVFPEDMTLIVMNIDLQAVSLAFIAIRSTENVVAIQWLKICIHTAYKTMCFIFLDNAFHLCTPQRQ
jgi:hypothetical protein